MKYPVLSVFFHSNIIIIYVGKIQHFPFMRLNNSYIYIYIINKRITLDLMKILSISMLVMMMGCAQDEIPRTGHVRTGETVNSPQGYIEMCNRDPKTPECNGINIKH